MVSSPDPAAARGRRPATLASVARRVRACTRCPRLRAWCAQVARKKVRRFAHERYWGRPVPGFGDPEAALLIVGLAPAAHGANRTGRMFTGDSSGDWLFGALHAHGFASASLSRSRADGLRLADCYVTAAARCAPPGNRPLPAELDACRPYLVDELRLLTRVRVVLTLGAIAHDGYLRAAGWRDRLAPARRPRFAHGSEALLPGGPVLLASYHPSRQNTNTGRLTAAMWDAVFRRARALAGEARAPGRKESGAPG